MSAAVLYLPYSYNSESIPVITEEVSRDVTLWVP